MVAFLKKKTGNDQKQVTTAYLTRTLINFL